MMKLKILIEPEIPNCEIPRSGDIICDKVTGDCYRLIKIEGEGKPISLFIRKNVPTDNSVLFVIARILGFLNLFIIFSCGYSPLKIMIGAIVFLYLESYGKCWVKKWTCGNCGKPLSDEYSNPPSGLICPACGSVCSYSGIFVRVWAEVEPIDKNLIDLKREKIRKVEIIKSQLFRISTPLFIDKGKLPRKGETICDSKTGDCYELIKVWLEKRDLPLSDNLKYTEDILWAEAKPLGINLKELEIEAHKILFTLFTKDLFTKEEKVFKIRKVDIVEEG